MKFIAHRVNTIEELKDLPPEFGVELDLRDRGDRLILQHDPFRDGQDFEEYLAAYRHGTMILNIKSERIELRILELLQRRGIEDFFFLDSSFPMIYLLSSRGETRNAVRFSEFEGLDTVLAVEGRAKWVWVDCFSRLPLTADIYRMLKQKGFLLCLVSPELQGRDGDIELYKRTLRETGIVFDAICTKKYNINRWR